MNNLQQTISEAWREGMRSGREIVLDLHAERAGKSLLEWNAKDSLDWDGLIEKIDGWGDAGEITVEKT